MDGNVPENGKQSSGSVAKDLSPRHRAKILRAMKAPRSVKRIDFDRTEASPEQRLVVRVPKLNKNEVLVLTMRTNWKKFTERSTASISIIR